MLTDPSLSLRMTGRRDDFRDFVSAIARDNTTLGEGAWSVGRLVSLKYALVLWVITKNLETFFISDLNEINIMIC